MYDGIWEMCLSPCLGAGGWEASLVTPLGMATSDLTRIKNTKIYGGGWRLLRRASAGYKVGFVGYGPCRVNALKILACNLHVGDREIR